MKKDLTWFVNERQKKMDELVVSRKKSRKLNKEIKDLNKVIADNLKEMVLTGEKIETDDKENGWIYQSEEQLEENLQAMGLLDLKLKNAK